MPRLELVRPMLENVPVDIVKDIKKMEQEFIRLQRCVS